MSSGREVRQRGTSALVRRVLLAAFLALQAVMVVAAPFGEHRFYCWAPHDAQSEYVISVSVGGRALSLDEVSRRYRVPADGVDPRAMSHILFLVEKYERTQWRSDDAVVRVRYRVNGGPWRMWSPGES